MMPKHSRSLLGGAVLTLVVAAGCTRSLDAALVSIDLGPSSPAFAKGLTIQLTATGRYDDGSTRDVSGVAAWSSSDASIAPVVANGTFAAAAVGTTSVSARVGDVVGRTDLSVLPPAAAALAVSPESATVPKGLTRQLTVTGTVMTDGSLGEAPASVTWRSSDPAIASVDAGGLATANRVGAATLVAAAGSLTGATRLTVDPPALVSVSIPPQVTVVRGLARQLRAMGTFTDGSLDDATAMLTWSTSDGAIARVDSQGVVRGVTGGTATVTGTFGSASVAVECTVLAQRVVFVTSESGPGNLGTWQSAAGRSGLAAADAVCNAAASRAGLPGTFRAWLSDGNDDAYCRLHRSLGKRIENCGGGTLPSDAGPWIRTDGFPFATSAADLVAGKVLVPVRYDETGRRLSGETPYFTASGLDGAVFTNGASTCADWTTADPTLRAWVGSSNGATWWWTISGLLECSTPVVHLLCLEVGLGSGPALPPYATAGKKAFATSVSGGGDLSAWPGASGYSGLAAADAICATRAAAAGLSGTFTAWLADSSHSAATRFTGDGPWVRLDGVLVAASKLELETGELRATVGIDDLGRYVGHEAAYTGAYGTGEPSLPNCSNWSDASVAAEGVAGTLASAGTPWTWFAPTTCAGEARLYCFEQ
jgi:uncharacterized protein YjdB